MPLARLRRCLARKGLIDRHVVGMAVGDLPLAILPAEYVGDSQCVGLDGDTDDRICDVFKADHVCHVTTDIGDHEIEAVVGRGDGGPLRLLEDNGYVRSVGVQHAARTGLKPSDTFLVNPAVWQPGSVNSVRRAV